MFDAQINLFNRSLKFIIIMMSCMLCMPYQSSQNRNGCNTIERYTIAKIELGEIHDLELNVKMQTHSLFLACTQSLLDRGLLKVLLRLYPEWCTLFDVQDFEHKGSHQNAAFVLGVFPSSIDESSCLAILCYIHKPRDYLQAGLHLEKNIVAIIHY